MNSSQQELRIVIAGNGFPRRLLLLAIGLFCAASPLLSPPAAAQTRYDNLILRDFDGMRFELKDIVARNKVTVLTFWASWCSPCRRELKELNRILHSPEGKNLAVVAVNIDESKDIIAARRFLKDSNIRITALYDDQEVARRAYQVTSLPRTFVIDSGGVIRSEHHGFSTTEAIEKAINRCLQ